MITFGKHFPRTDTGVQAGAPIPIVAPAKLEALSPSEASALDRCEQTIRKGLKTFVEVGQALMEIRDRRLYREHYTTWEEYCRGTWGFTARFATYQIEGASVVQELKATAALLPERVSNQPFKVKPVEAVWPAAESQARPLTRLPAAERLPAWDKAVKTSNGKPTARHVEAAVREREVTVADRAGEATPAPAPPDTRIGKILVAVEAALDRLEILRKLIDVTDTPCQKGLVRAVIELRAIEVKFKQKRNNAIAKQNGWKPVPQKRKPKTAVKPPKPAGFVILREPIRRGKEPWERDRYQGRTGSWRPNPRKVDAFKDYNEALKRCHGDKVVSLSEALQKFSQTQTNRSLRDAQIREEVSK